MLRHTLMLLVTTVLGSFAEFEFFKDRRNDFNGNANSNDIYGRFENGLDNRYPALTPIDDDRGWPQLTRPVPLPGSYLPKGGNGINGGGWGEIEIGFLPDDGNYGEYCDDDSNAIFKPNSFFRDAVHQESRRFRDFRPYGNNVNSNANNNAIGMRYRRVSQWTGRPSKYPYVLDYDKVHHGSNVNSNSNSNILGGRRSNINTNINNNQIAPYAGQDYGSIRGRRKHQPSYESPYGEIIDPGFGGSGSLQNQPSYEWPYGEIIDPGFGGSGSLQNQPSYELPYGEIIDPGFGGSGSLQNQKKRKQISYPGGKISDEDGNDYRGSSSANRNVNLNSNTNIVGRRSNSNANTNSNALSRNRRSVEIPLNDIDNVANNGDGKVSDISTKRQVTAENRHGAIYRRLD